jgi:hypothetical protein
MHTDNAQKRGKPFPLGNRSGKGRPVGSRNKAKLLLEAMMEGGAVAVGQKFMELVQNGNVPVMKMYMDRIYPVQRERLVHLDLPEIVTADDVTTAIGIVIKQVALGKITPAEGERMTHLVESQGKVMERQKHQKLGNQQEVQPDPRLEALTDEELDQLEQLLRKASDVAPSLGDQKGPPAE